MNGTLLDTATNTYFGITFIEILKSENKNLMKQINIISKSSTEINNRPPLVSNVRGTGRKSRVDESTLNLMKSLKNQGLSYSKIAKKLEEETNSQWSKSTVSYVLNKNT